VTYPGSRNVFVLVIVGVAIVMFALLTHFIKSGRPWMAATTVWVASPLVVLGVWWLVQKGQPYFSEMSFGSISYAAVVGDIVVLPAAAIVTAYGWKAAANEMAPFWKSGWWLAISSLIGLAAGIGFHLMGGPANSNSSELSVRLHDSPLSWAHNLGVFTALFGAFVFALVPLLFTAAGRSLGLLAVAIGIIGWGGLSVIDNIRMRLPLDSYWRFNPQWMDVDFDWRHWRPRTAS
jgi:hypothetical protein